MFRIIFPNTWYVDHHGTPCKILRSTHNKVHYIRKGRTCIASMFRFNHDFEPVNKADADRIAEEIETAEHIKKLRDMRSKSRSSNGITQPQTQRGMLTPPFHSSTGENNERS